MTLSAPTQNGTGVPRPAALPEPTGPLSGQVLALLRRQPDEWLPSSTLPASETEAIEAAIAAVDPLVDGDLQLALYICFELSYRGFADVDPRWESEVPLFQTRHLLECAFLDAVAAVVPEDPVVDPGRIGERLFEIEAADDGPPVARFLESRATVEQFREFVIHRSAYQLKEADPHSWAIPRIAGPPKAALLEIQSDEYGGGHGERAHSLLFVKTMAGLGLDSRPNAYLGRLPGSTLATVNLMSALGTRRSRLGAIVGHLAMFEMTSSRSNRAYGNGLRRLGADGRTTDFYDEHVVADAVHENIAAYDMAGTLARQEPGLAADILFGARALLELEARFARHLLESWHEGGSSLLDGSRSHLRAAA